MTFFQGLWLRDKCNSLDFKFIVPIGQNAVHKTKDPAVNCPSLPTFAAKFN